MAAFKKLSFIQQVFNMYNVLSSLIIETTAVSNQPKILPFIELIL